MHNVLAIYQKAEALYHLGDFEHSLVFYHRGLHVRPELEQFRLGVQKAREAIENAIGESIDAIGYNCPKSMINAVFFFLVIQLTSHYSTIHLVLVKF